MESLVKLKELYDSNLKDELLLLESQRKNLLRHYYHILLLILLGFGSFALIDYLGVTVFFIWVLIILFMYVSGKNIQKKTNLYKTVFKSNIVAHIIKIIDPEWNYTPHSYINKNKYSKSGIFTKPFDRYRGDDLITGVIDKTDFQMSELHTEYKNVTTDNKGRTEVRWDTIFKGLFLHIDFNKKIKGQTFVVPDYTENIFGKWAQKFQTSNYRGQLVKLENQEFENSFAVYSNDQIEARYILTPKMMEAIVDLKKQINRIIYISFIESRVYIAIPILSTDLFEPKIFRTGVNYSDVKEIYFYLNTVSIIIKEMNLNTRIWTKE